MSDDIFSNAEQALIIKIPLCIKNMLCVNGYDSETLISNISEQDLSDIEDFARNTLFTLITEDKYVDYYGMFNRNTVSYKIFSGQRKLFLRFLNIANKKSNKEVIQPF